VYFRIQGTVQTVSSVAQSPVSTPFIGQSVTVTATLSGNLSTGQGVYIRYTKDGYSTSTVAEMNVSGTSATFTIPGSFNTSGASVSYYIFTSTDDDTKVNTNGANADFYTINLNNNGGSNYAYTVTSTYGTIADGNFSTAASWANNAVPPTGSALTINHDVSIDANYTASTIAIASGKTLTVAASNTLAVGGGITTTGNLAVNGTLQINSGGFVSSSNITYGASGALTYNTGGTYNTSNEWLATNGPKSVTIINSSVTLSGNRNIESQLTISGGSLSTGSATLNINETAVLTMTGGTLTTNNRVVFKSTATGTGRLAYTSGTITGNVAVERFISSKTARKSIFLASPVSQTISSAWQQQIHITGAGTGGTICPTLTAHSNGFDATLTNAPSMFTYNHAAGSGNRWQSIANTSSTSLTPGVGYRVIVRGPRSAGCSLLDASTNAQAAVTLTATGAPQTGNVAATIAGSNGFSLVGNPYISPINWNNSTWALTDRPANGIAGSYWLYNPENAAGTYSVYNGVTMTNQGAITNPNIIGIGQSFFVQKTTAGDGAISNFFKPDYQVATNQVGAFRTANTWLGQVRVKMFVAGAPTATDEVILLYGNGNSINNNSLGSFDAVTLNQGAVNMIASYKNADLLAINTREQLGAATNDTIQLFIQNADGNYNLTVAELNTLPYEAFLIDGFNNSVVNLQSQPSYNYTVTSDPATKGNRFKIVFRTAGTLPVAFLNINATTKAGNNTIHWTVAQSNAVTYVVERSANGRNFTEIAKLNAGNATSYSYVDIVNNANTLFYRVKAVAANGTFKYSSVVKVNSEASIDLSLYPNPVQNTLNIQLGQQVKGQVNVRVLDSKGTVVLERSGLYPANTNFIQLEVGHLPYGKYLLQLTNGSDFVASGSFVK
jgi:hypothetical protein